ncbi:MAG: hypothetical protein M9921_14495 [Fimbriimonadaceae bacterium]|nr:hypothetical protein [Chthonomonadaceae bacterium]MCO5298054.1 hypothetical protein [Fimbriimonadaceae bacterium]
MNRLPGDDHDPYGAVSWWFHRAKKDPETFLRDFEGVIPEVRGLEWGPITGWTYVASSVSTNMVYDSDPWPFERSEGGRPLWCEVCQVPTNMIYDPSP